jgi:hypothetical protein
VTTLKTLLGVLGKLAYLDPLLTMLEEKAGGKGWRKRLDGKPLCY